MHVREQAHNSTPATDLHSNHLNLTANATQRAGDMPGKAAFSRSWGRTVGRREGSGQSSTPYFLSYTKSGLNLLAFKMARCDETPFSAVWFLCTYSFIAILSK